MFLKKHFFRTCAYQGVSNVSFSENFANVLNEWSQDTCWIAELHSTATLLIGNQNKSKMKLARAVYRKCSMKKVNNCAIFFYNKVTHSRPETLNRLCPHHESVHSVKKRHNLCMNYASLDHEYLDCVSWNTFNYDNVEVSLLFISYWGKQALKCLSTIMKFIIFFFPF